MKPLDVVLPPPPLPNSDDEVDVEFKLKKFMLFITFGDPMVLENVEADSAA